MLKEFMNGLIINGKGKPDNNIEEVENSKRY